MPLSEYFLSKLKNYFGALFLFKFTPLCNFTGSFCRLLLFLFGILQSVLGSEVRVSAQARRGTSRVSAGGADCGVAAGCAGGPSTLPRARAKAALRPRRHQQPAQAHSDYDVRTVCPFMSSDMVDGHSGHMASCTRRD